MQSVMSPLSPDAKKLTTILKLRYHNSRSACASKRRNTTSHTGKDAQPLGLGDDFWRDFSQDFELLALGRFESGCCG
jgi:hypothetical protein